MTIFWLGAALLVAITLGLLIPPLLGRGRWASVDRDRLNVGLYEDRLIELEQELASDEITREQFEAARGELQRDLLNTTGNREKRSGAAISSRRAALVVGVAVPLFALALYWQIGAPQLAANQHSAAQQMPGDIGKLVETLQQRLEQNPNDVEGWKLLGRTMLFTERYDEAAQAIGRAVELTKSAPDADLLAEHADVLAFTQGGSLAGKPIELVEQSLALDPKNQRALWLSGIHAYNLGEIPTALKQWRHLLTLLPPDAEAAVSLRQTIAQAEAEATGGTLSPPESTAAKSSVAIKVNLGIDDKLADKVAPEDTLFLFVRPVNGPKMPIAAIRRTADKLPLTLTLSDADVLIAGQSLSDFSQLEIVARISKSGDATARSGDLEGRANVTVGSDQTVNVRIATVAP